MAGDQGRKERKMVTVLFADLAGFTSRAETLDPEDVEAILVPYHERLRAEIERFAGTVEKFIGDAVMALFGAPFAHEDDPERAVRAALAIRDWARADGLDVRVAVNTGEALVRVDARVEAGEGMATGDVVNTAARLEAAAPVGGILVGEATYRATRQAIEYRLAEPVIAKGKAGPIAVWEAVRSRVPIGPDISGPHAIPLVSREGELVTLRKALAHARGKRASERVTLIGVPGIGKSRLVHELTRSTEAEGVRWLRGRCLPYGIGVSFWAFAEMVKAQLEIFESDAPEVCQRKLRKGAAAVLGDEQEFHWVEQHLQPLVGLGASLATSRDRRAESFAAWRRFLAATAAELPVALVFEDLHWADDDLLDFVESLSEWLTDVPMFVLCTARPELLERRPAWSAAKPGSTVLSLHALNETETATLIAKLVERAVLPAEVQSALVARAGGNPLYAEQYVRMLVERGDSEGVPEGVHGIIAARLDALSPEDKDLLESAAVIGRVFWPSAVAAISGRDQWTIGERLHWLERKELVMRSAESPVGGEPAYAFAHMLVRDVAYGLIPRAQRADRHQQAAEWIKSLGRLNEHAEMLGHHYLSALQFAAAAGRSPESLAEPAREALRAAGDRSFALNAYAGAARSYGAARDLWPKGHIERARLSFLLGRARFFAEESGAEELAEASLLLATEGDMETAAEAELLLVELSRRHAAHDAATGHLEKARALLDGRPISPAQCRVAGASARHLFLAGDHEGAITAGREALRLSEALGLDEVRAEALNTIGISRLWSGDLGGVADVEQSAAIAGEIASAHELVRAQGNLMVSALARGDIAGSAELATEVLSMAERLGQAPALRWYRPVRFTFPYWFGDWDQAAKEADEFIVEIERGAIHYAAVQAYCCRADIRVGRGDVAGALADAQRALSIGRDVQDAQQLYRAVGLCSLTFAESGLLEQAAALVDEECAALEGGVELQLAVVALPALAHTARATGRTDEIRKVLASRFRWSRWADAARAIASGDLVQAADICTSMGSRTDAALSRLRGAEQLAGQGRRHQADQLLGDALAFYRSVRAARYIHEAESLQARKTRTP